MLGINQGVILSIPLISSSGSISFLIRFHLF